MFASNKEAAESAKEIREIRQEDVHRVDEISEHMAHTIRSTLETATQLAERSVDRFGQAFGFSERDGGETVQQSLRNIQAVTERTTVLVHGVQDISREWSDWPQQRFERHLDGFNALLHCRTPQDLILTQSNLARGNLELLLTSRRRIEVDSRCGEGHAEGHGPG